MTKLGSTMLQGPHEALYLVLQGIPLLPQRPQSALTQGCHTSCTGLCMYSAPAALVYKRSSGLHHAVACAACSTTCCCRGFGLGSKGLQPCLL